MFRRFLFAATVVVGHFAIPCLADIGKANTEIVAKPESILAAVNRMAPKYGLDPALVAAVIFAESGFDPYAVSPKNAKGLMQLMPDTATRFGVSDSFDATQNLEGGMRYLKWLYDRFNGNLPLVLAAYNAGEKAVVQYGGIPPYPETKGYVAKVLRNYRNWTHSAQAQANMPAIRQIAPVISTPSPPPSNSSEIGQTPANARATESPGRCTWSYSLTTMTLQIICGPAASSPHIEAEMASRSRSPERKSQDVPDW